MAYMKSATLQISIIVICYSQHITPTSIFCVLSVAIYANDVFQVCYKQPVFNSASVRTKDEAFNNSIEQINCTPTQTE